MEFVVILLVAAATFGLCFLADRGFTKAFRGKEQHASGLSVRLSKRYGSIGLVLAVIGLAAVFSGKGQPVLLYGGLFVVLLGVGLIVYYMTFGVFYDSDSFILTTFGKKSVTYRYRDIKGQLLYLVAGGNVLVELYLEDGRTVSLQSTMDGMYPFLDTAFAGWCVQKGLRPEDCAFHDPGNSCWFPNLEGK